MVIPGPNENYARELMELHTLGVDSGYAETDTSQVVHCFTGTRSNPNHRMPTPRGSTAALT